MKRILLPVLGAGLLLLSACGTEDGGPSTISTTAPILPGVNGMEALFAPSSDPAVPSILPSPNNAAFAGSTDGTLNIPVVDPNDLTDPKVAINALDGFSTVAPMATSFGEALDPATVAAGVHVYDASTAVPTELTFGQHYVALPSPSDATVLVIKPIVPLKSATNYLVVVTSDLKSVSGKPAAASKIFTLMKSPVPLVDASGVSQVPGVPDASAVGLEGLRQTVLPALNTAKAFGITKDKVAVAWSFKTQTIGKVLTAIQAASAGDPYASVATNFLTAATTPSALTGGLGTVDFYTFATVVAVANGSTGLRDAYAASPSSFDTIGSVVLGAVKLPYYLDAAANANDPAPLFTQFAMDAATGLPLVKSVQTIPFIMTIPKQPAKVTLGNRYPVVIFQHGFAVDKSVVFGIANSLSKAGFAVIAMDAVLHGQRTFGLDLLTQVVDANGRPQTTAAAPDGTVDSSGAHYLNLTSLLTSRDNIRQEVADLIHLTRLLELQNLLTGMDVVDKNTGLPVLGGDGTPDLIVSAAVPVSYVGHSNGGILGGVLAGVEPAIKTFVLVNPGGDYASILQNSVAYGPIVEAGLASKGVIKGSADFNAFFFAAQTVVDDGDPLNYAASAVGAGKNILLLKTLNDGVVPNPQTDSLSLALGLKQVASATTSSVWPLGAVDGNATPQLPPALPLGGFTGNGFTFFTQGTHSSVLTPDPAGLLGLDIITEMQSEVIYYLASGLGGTATVYVGATPLPSTNAASSVVQ